MGKDLAGNCGPWPAKFTAACVLDPSMPTIGMGGWVGKVQSRVQSRGEGVSMNSLSGRQNPGAHCHPAHSVLELRRWSRVFPPLCYKELLALP